MALWQYLIQSGFKKLMKALSFDLHELATKWVTSSKRHATFFQIQKDKRCEKKHECYHISHEAEAEYFLILYVVYSGY